MDKQNIVYPYNGILFIHEWNKVLRHATVWMYLENTMLSEVKEGRCKITHLWFHLYETARIDKSIQTEGRLMIAMG